MYSLTVLDDKRNYPKARHNRQDVTPQNNKQKWVIDKQSKINRQKSPIQVQADCDKRRQREGITELGLTARIHQGQIRRTVQWNDWQAASEDGLAS